MRFLPVLMVALLLACEVKSGEPAIPIAGKDYKIELGPKTVTAGAPASCELSIVPQAPWALKLETPFKAHLEGGARLKLAKSDFTKEDYVDPKAPAKRLQTSCTAAQAGEHRLEATLSFFLCSNEICKKMDEKVSVAIAAK